MEKDNTVIIGLTGPTGAGKSTACKAAEKLGFAVIDADRVAREVTEKGSALLPILKEAFGNVLNPDGTLCRKKLAAKAFRTPQNTERLNAVMLPAITEKIAQKIKTLQSNGQRFILLDAPTLFESGADRLCTATMAVLAPKDVRLSRIMARDKLTKAAAELRMSAGKPDRFYLEHCDRIFNNHGTKEALYLAATRFFESFSLTQ